MNKYTPEQLIAEISKVDPLYAKRIAARRKVKAVDQLAGLIQDAEKTDPNFGKRLFNTAQQTAKNRDTMQVALWNPLTGGSEAKPITTVEDFILHSCGLARRG